MPKRKRGNNASSTPLPRESPNIDVAPIIKETPRDYTVKWDLGGNVGEYRRRYEKLRDDGKKVIIDGICNSACTTAFGIMPKDKLCVTDYASLGFHQASFDKRSTGGKRVKSMEATADLMNGYKKYPPLAKWIEENGGLGEKMLYLKGAKLKEILPSCSGDAGRKPAGMSERRAAVSGVRPARPWKDPSPPKPAPAVPIPARPQP